MAIVTYSSRSLTQNSDERREQKAHIGGRTLHALVKMSVRRNGEKAEKKFGRKTMGPEANNLVAMWRDVKTLVIDEVS